MEVICPPCAGTGCVAGKVWDGCPPCRLCNGTGCIVPEVEDAFWACISDSPNWQAEPSTCISKVLGTWS